jgi:UDP-glucose 4-epimerase
MTAVPSGGADYRAFYRHRRVAITGGLGFIGSNLAHRLVELGAQVLLIDALIPDCGGTMFNIAGIEDRVRLNIADVRERNAMNCLVQDQEVIFNLAGQVSHVDSMRDPDTDLDINCRGQLALLEACRWHNRAVRIVYASTRQVYGRPDALPVTERHAVRPTDVNGINKAAGEQYHLVYGSVYGMPTTVLRMTNVFGPRQLLKHDRQGFIAWFVRRAIEGREIEIFGDGSQIRDLVFVDDAVEACLRAGADAGAGGRCFNVGGAEPVTLRALAELLIDVAESGSYRLIDWPPERRAIDIGSFYADSTLIRETLGWRPLTPLRDGLARTVAYFRTHWGHYVPAGALMKAS